MKDLNKLALLISKPKYFEYFFKKLDRPDLFDWLDKEIHAFDSVPEPQLTDDGQYIQFSPWWPGKYLIKVVNKIPEKVFEVLKKIKTDNRLALDDCEQAILNMPDEFLKNNSVDIINLFDRWLDSKYVGLIHYKTTDLFKRYLDQEFYEGASKLLDILSKTVSDKTKDIRFRFETYYYKELIDEHFPKLLGNRPFDILNIIEKHLKEALDTESKDRDSAEDFSTIWRPTIEDSSQNLDYDDVKDIFSKILRDTLHKISHISSQKAREIIERYLNERYSIFKRLAIHAIRVNNFDDFAGILLTDKNNLDEPEIHHEFFKLVEEKFRVLNSEQKRLFITWIEDGPAKKDTEKEEEFKRYKRFWQARILLMIKEYIEKEEDLKEFRYLLSEYKYEFGKIEHPDFLTYSTSWVGPTSPLTTEEIAKMTPEEFINWIKNNLLPPYEMMGPSPEGVSRIFQGLVKENPEPYALLAEKFLDEQIWPAYLCGFIRGLENAVKEGTIFNLEPVLKFIEAPLKFHSEPEVKSRHDEFDIGQYSWLRGAISNFIEELVKKNEILLNQDIMDRTQKVLFELIEKDENPTEDSEKKYGPDAKNMDYVTYCINSNRGKAMHALIQHALRRARMRPDEEKKAEKDKGTFPHGERMNLYKAFFTKRLDEEISPSVQSSYGQSLPYLFYLDQEWVEQMKKRGKLFPREEEKNRFWEAHWQGYIGFNNFYDQIYYLLKDDYKKAIDTLSDKKESKKIFGSYDDRLAEHLMIAYWRSLEEISEKGEILNTFFRKASRNLRSHAILFLVRALREVKPSKDSEEWIRMKNLWEQRLKKANDSELASFARWLKYSPESLVDILYLIKPIIPYLHVGYQEEDLLEYINENIEINTEKALQILNELYGIKESLLNIHFRLDLTKDILTKAGKYKDRPEVAVEINKAVNRLGEMGYYDFKDLLIEKQN